MRYEYIYVSLPKHLQSRDTLCSPPLPSRLGVTNAHLDFEYIDPPTRESVPTTASQPTKHSQNVLPLTPPNSPPPPALPQCQTHPTPHPHRRPQTRLRPSNGAPRRPRPPLPLLAQPLAPHPAHLRSDHGRLDASDFQLPEEQLERCQQRAVFSANERRGEKDSGRRGLFRAAAAVDLGQY
jgi:hypothetical protein